MTATTSSLWLKFPNRRLLAGWLYLAVTSVGAAIVVAAAARYLPTEQAGIWFTLQSVVAFALLGDLGLSVTGVRQMAHSYAAALDARGSWIRVSGMVETRTGLAGISDVMAALRYLRRYTFPLCGLIGATLGVILFSHGSISTPTRVTAILACAIMIVATLGQLDGLRYQAALEGIGRIDVERNVLSATYLLTYAVIVAVMLATRNIAAMALVWLCGTLAGRFALRLILKRMVGVLPPASSDARVNAHAMLRVSASVWLVALGAAVTIYSQAPAINLFLGAAALPGYYLAYRVLSTAGSSLAVIIQADRALFTQELAAGRLASAYARVRRCTILLAAGSTAMAVSFMIAGRWLITTWLRNPSAIDEVTVRILAVDAGLTTFVGLIGQFVLASGRNPFVPSVILSGVFNVVLLLVLVPALGIRGAPLASLGAGLLTSYWYNLYQGAKMIKSLRAQPQA
jgi:O-antigen/teichoic acid export membrane protein